MVVTMSAPPTESQEETSSPPLLPAATSFVVSFDPPQPPPHTRPNKFVKRHMRNLSLPVAPVYSTSNNNNNKLNNGYSDTNGVTKPLENHSEGYFSSDPEDEAPHVQLTKPSSEISMSTSQSKTRSVHENGKCRSIPKSGSVLENGTKAGEKEDEDKSDGGTYTIDQDSNEVINARLSIDKTFGITTSEHKFKDYTEENLSTDIKGWIDEWATQVLEQNQKKSPGSCSNLSSNLSSRGVTPGSCSNLSSGAITSAPPSFASRGGVTPGSCSNLSSNLSSRGVTPGSCTNLASRGISSSHLPGRATTPGSCSSLASRGAVVSKIPSPVYTRAKCPPAAPMNTPKTDLTPTSPPKQRTVSLSAVNMQDDCSDSSLETESYLRATEQVVSDMFARAASLGVDSGDSDGDASPAGGLTGKVAADHLAADHLSDSSCEVAVPHAARRSLLDKSAAAGSSSSKYNRAFSLRRNKNLTGGKSTEPPTPAAPASSSVRKCAPPVTASAKTAGSNPGSRQAFSRTDCGRFSMRAPIKTPTPVTSTSLSVPKTAGGAAPSSAAAAGRRGGDKTKAAGSCGGGGGASGAARSNSSLSSRELEFQNWKRRKSYDPMKAAAEGKRGGGGGGGSKKAGAGGGGGAVASGMSASMTASMMMTQSVCLPQPETEPVSSVLRSASFHGTNQLQAACGVKSSSDDNEEEEEEEEEEWAGSQAPKTSLETTPRGSKTSLCSLGTNSSSSNVKLKTTKIEGVDSMVITAIASMSVKLKANSSHFLRKLRVLYSEENSKHGLLTGEIEKLNAADSLNNSPVKSPSRQLTATLCNLKKIENALRVMDEAIFDCEEFE